MILLSATDSAGNTPLSPEERADLIPSLATKKELNEFERENILPAREWVLAARTAAREMASDEFVRHLHSRMFDQTWKWAGQYRTTDQNIGVPFHQIAENLAVLCGEVRYWIDHATYSPTKSRSDFIIDWLPSTRSQMATAGMPG
jgi:fido (protein-threonine AMPylation protein)